MEFTNEQLDQIIALFRDELGVEIDRAEARRQATSLINLIKQVYRPMSKKDFAKYVAKVKNYR
ncbi:MAG: hypothetical protein WCW25_02330 [Patescibacteria group bacterium]|jgi:hypothetical protein